MTDSPTVVVGVGGGIAAYKIVFLVRQFRKAGWNVFVTPTEASTEFVGLTTWRELSENPVATSVFDEEVSHVEVARNADLIVIAPATADLLAKLRSGFAPDMLGNVWLASDAPRVVVPAMHTNMWTNPATQENITTLRKWGVHVLEPISGDLSSGDTGSGRMPEPEDIYDFAMDVYRGTKSAPLAGRKVVVTAGGTQEAIDPVRYIGNRSSGKQGIALAEEARNAGAEVTLIHANVEVPLPVHSDMKLVSAPSAAQLKEAVEAELPDTDCLIMAAAVADFTPISEAEQKIKKQEEQEGLTLNLVRTPDILASVARSKLRPPVLVGFGAETGDLETVLDFGAKKAVAKGSDLLAVNMVGAGVGFGDVPNSLYYFDKGGQRVGMAEGSKNEVASDLLKRVTHLLESPRRAKKNDG